MNIYLCYLHFFSQKNIYLMGIYLKNNIGLWKWLPNSNCKNKRFSGTGITFIPNWYIIKLYIQLFESGGLQSIGNYTLITETQKSTFFMQHIVWVQFLPPDHESVIRINYITRKIKLFLESFCFIPICSWINWKTSPLDIK